MSKLTSAVRRFVRDEEGATMAEYALLVAVIALVALAGAKTLGNNIANKWLRSILSRGHGNTQSGTFIDKTPVPLYSKCCSQACRFQWRSVSSTVGGYNR